MHAGPIGNMENSSHKFLINNENVPGKYVATKFKSITQIRNSNSGSSYSYKGRSQSRIIRTQGKK